MMKPSEDMPVESLPQQIIKHLKAVYGMNDNKATTMVLGAVDSLEETLAAMLSALKAKDCFNLQKATHNFKGALQNMGLTQLADLARVIEEESTRGIVMPDKEVTTFAHQIRNLITEIQNET